MRTSHSLNPSILLAAAAIALGAANARADSLILIPTLDGDTSNQGRAITPDGRFVVGLSGSRGFLYPVGGAGAINVISSDGAQSTIATGVGYRTYNSQLELIVRGLSSSGNTDWMTLNGGTTWGVKRRDTNLGASPWTIPAANAMSSSSTDVYYSAFRDNNNYLYLGRAWGAWAPASNTMTLAIDRKSVPTAESATINGVSSTGRAVGKRGGRNYVMDWTGGGSGSVWFPIGLQNNQTGQVFSVSSDGSVLFGQSPVSDGRSGNWGYKSLYSGTTLLSINELPYFADTAGSSSLLVPYGCTADGSFAVGMNYRGTEKAVLWDTSDANPANWTITDLTDLASSQGILDGFDRLNRAYSIGRDAAGDWVITGTGSWSPDGGTTPYTTRAFVMTILIPEPTTFSLLAVGVCAFLALRRQRR